MRALGGVVGAVVLVIAPFARADGDQRAAAQVLFEQGRALVEQKNFAEACPKLAESLRLDPGIGTMLWLADCHENAGQTASAWAEFKEAAAAAALKSDPREKIARDRAAALEPKLARVRIVVPRDAAVSGLELRRDGVVVGAAEWDVPVPMDAGEHTIAATAPGRKGWSTAARNMTPSATVTVTIPVLASSGDAPPPDPTRPPPPPESTDPSAGSTQRIVGIAVAGAGIVGIGVGTFFAFHAKSTYDDSNANKHCLPDNTCDAAGTSLRHDATSQAAVATIAMIAGGAALVGGAVLYLTAPRARTQVAIAPSTNGGAITVRGAW